MANTRYSQEIEIRGHIIDSAILTKIYDGIMDLNGEFEAKDIKVGKMKNDVSFAKLTIYGKNKRHLDRILEFVYRNGATAVTVKPVILKSASKNMIMPDNFYSTTNNNTQVFLNSKWISVDNIMMDKCIVVKSGKASCVAIRDVKKNDKIIVGDRGVRVQPPQRPRGGVEVFEFMGSSSSSERPTHHIAKNMAKDMAMIRKKGGKIILVGGPAIIHTGVSDVIAWMIKHNYINGVLAGNALAVHDIEYATLGTSLGMNMHDGTLAVRGHRNHMDAINSVFKSGSIANMVKSGKLKKGIMYECIKNRVPFVLAASIRDDGPLPDVIIDITKAQREYKKVLKGADMVIMVSTMLHSIATGNMLPANTKIIVIDISQPTVTKLIDRGTWQALGIVSDVGAFFPIILQELKKMHR